MRNIIKVAMVAFISMVSATTYADNVTSSTSNTTVITKPAAITDDNPNATTKTSSTITTTSVDDKDSDIVTEIYAKYAKDSALIGTNLSVSCLNGVVTIFGKVTAQAQADEAVIVAKSIRGVKDARSSIDVSTNPGNNKQVVTPNY